MNYDYSNLATIGDKTILSPLARRLLKIIKRDAGINRRCLFNATQRNFKASELTNALAELRNARLAYCRTEKTAGHPAECWYDKGRIENAVRYWQGTFGI